MRHKRTCIVELFAVDLAFQRQVANRTCRIQADEESGIAADGLHVCLMDAGNRMTASVKCTCESLCIIGILRSDRLPLLRGQLDILYQADGLILHRILRDVRGGTADDLTETFQLHFIGNLIQVFCLVIPGDIVLHGQFHRNLQRFLSHCEDAVFSFFGEVAFCLDFVAILARCQVIDSRFSGLDHLICAVVHRKFLIFRKICIGGERYFRSFLHLYGDGP